MRQLVLLKPYSGAGVQCALQEHLWLILLWLNLAVSTQHGATCQGLVVSQQNLKLHTANFYFALLLVESMFMRSLRRCFQNLM